MSDSFQLKIALIQADLYWKDKVANFSMLEEKIWAVGEKVDLIILPEMFSTGFSMDVSELAEPMNLTACRWLQQQAAQTGAVVTGSVIIKEEKGYFNRLLWVEPNGKIQHYDKRHLFRMAQEDEHFSAGQNQPVFQWKGWKILPQVCYDLRFPVWSRNTSSEGQMAYDLVFYVASWPAPRVSAWDALLPARAIENLAYSIGVNRVGTDGNKVPYCGHSAVYDFKGQSLLSLGEDENTEVLTLSLADLTDYRKKFPAWMDSDKFSIHK
ncbi:Carbon-nitrogen hydrolase [Algoriphagus faecimaris]|uniref:Omega-amidase YafV n=1 Tax=Algoriphagus faecimaris TaxID=686796 RepID=A0A1G6N1B0_9BACT|nr:amidohydrolase [Algoriphagus faecimaris]SDC60905.1 Carbon-nitrogen hydrolase [Algoriphagus faecimaris]